MRRLLALLLAAASPASAAGGADPFAFLLLPSDARPAALGGAVTASAEGASAVFGNPAGLADTPSHSLSFLHTKHFEGVNQGAAAAAFRQGWGVGANYLDYGKIPRTTISNQTGSGLGHYGAQDMAATVGYGVRASQTHSLGAAVKHVRGSIDGVVASATAFDVGGRIELSASRGWPVTLGWSVQNLGLSQAKFRNAQESLPVQASAGASWLLELERSSLLLTGDARKAGSDQATPHAGAEWRGLGGLSLRGGFDGRRSAGPGITAGAGWSLGRFALDYAFTPFGALGDTHRVSLWFRWGQESRRQALNRWRDQPLDPRFFEPERRSRLRS